MTRIAGVDEGVIVIVLLEDGGYQMTAGVLCAERLFRAVFQKVAACQKQGTVQDDDGGSLAKDRALGKATRFTVGPTIGICLEGAISASVGAFRRGSGGVEVSEPNGDGRPATVTIDGV